MRIMLAGDRSIGYFGASLRTVMDSGERRTHMSHGTWILRPSKEVKLPWNICQIIPIGAVQTFKQTHTKLKNKNAPAKRRRETLLNLSKNLYMRVPQLHYELALPKQGHRASGTLPLTAN